VRDAWWKATISRSVNRDSSTADRPEHRTPSCRRAAQPNRPDAQTCTHSETGRAAFTVVVRTGRDIAALAALQRRLHLHPIWLAPDGATPARVLAAMRWLAEPARAHGWNLTTRFEVLITGPGGNRR
jgi:hypothetical protein